MGSMNTCQGFVRSGLLALAVTTGASTAQCDLAWAASDPAPYLAGNARDLVVWDPDGAGPLASRIVVGGNSLSAGSFVGANLVMFDGATWTALPTAGPVVKLGLVQGQLLAATTYPNPSSTGPSEFNRLSVQSLAGYSIVCNAVEGRINAITEFAGETVFAGDFLRAAGVARLRIAKITSAGQVVALGAGVGDLLSSLQKVSALAVFNGRLIVGGRFPVAGGVAAGNLASWNGSVWAPMGDPNGPVHDLVVRTATTVNNTFLFAAGEFTAFGPLPRAFVARYSDATNAWAAMDASASTYSLAVRGVGLTGYELYASNGGGLKRWMGTGWTGVLGGASVLGTYRRIELWNGECYAMGGDTPILSTFWSNDIRLLKLVADAFVPVASNAGIAGAVRAALPDGSDYVIGGSFRTINGAAVNGIARGRPGAWQPLGGGVDGGSVLALARLPGGDLVAGGDFTSAGGQPAQGLARWNGSAWSPFGGGGVVRALAVMANGDLLVGGSFATMGGTPANNVARWNGSVWSALGAGVGGVAAMVRCFRPLANGDIAVGGTFTTAGASAAVNIARWSGSVWAPYGTGLGQTLQSIDQLATGEVIAWSANFGSVAQVWNGLFWSSAGAAAGVSAGAALLPNGGVAYAAAWSHEGVSLITGLSTVAVRATPPNGSTAGYATWPIAAWAIEGVVVAPNGDIAIFGDLWARGPRGIVASTPLDVSCSGFVVLQPTCPASVASVPSGCSGGATPDFAARSLPWLGGVYRARATGLAANSIALEVLGLQPANLPLAAVLPQTAAGCLLLAVSDAVYAHVPAAGVVDVQLAIPATPSLVGLTIHHQVVELEFAAVGGIAAVRTSPGLRPQLGTY